MKKLVFLLIFIFLFFSMESPALAAKKRVAKPRAGTTVAATVSQGVGAWVRLRSDRLALLINFSNFGNLQSGSYELTYTANGVGQGAGGSIILGDSSTKTLLFGTCSKGDCTYHYNITGGQLKIVSVLKSGQKVIKPYRIKV